MKRALKTVFFSFLRVGLLMPLGLAAYLCDALSMFFDRLSAGLFDMATATRQITMLPYVQDIKDSLDDGKHAGLKTLFDYLK